jgi:hypothetical protein
MEHSELQPRIRSVNRLIVVAALAAYLASACGGSTPAGLSQGKAVSAAQRTAQAMSTTPVSFVSAASGRFGDFEPHVGTAVSDPNRQVWAVAFRGTFHGSCGPASPPPHACPAPNTTIRVVLDYASGAFIMAATGAGTA